ncbi:hypothetical protein E2562_032517 [Oryza meyeriana var. granulata]|uniref:Uncharacterized protein n=1 Tax=Oryza meyeriana var. granulata TaxID=110450 RepID=A0A6G1DQU7_9ORYZ|nr:hypothetical protein E2562_032517 [Oryza meyeriana var. granulata]
MNGKTIDLDVGRRDTVTTVKDKNHAEEKLNPRSKRDIALANARTVNCPNCRVQANVYYSNTEDDEEPDDEGCVFLSVLISRLVAASSSNVQTRLMKGRINE